MDKYDLENRIIERFVRKKLTGGQSRFARLVDAVVLRLLIFIAAYFLFASRFKNSGKAWLLAAIVLAIMMLLMHLIGEIRYARCYARTIADVQRMLLQKTLLLLPQQALIPLVSSLCPMGSAPIVLQRALPIHANDLLSVVRTHPMESVLHIFSCTPYEKTAREFAISLRDRICLHAPEELLQAAKADGMQCDTDAVRREILATCAFEKEQKRKNLPKPFHPGYAGKYVLLAGALTLLSFLTQYALYYRLLAGVCMTIAAMGAYGRRKPGVH